MQWLDLTMYVCMNEKWVIHEIRFIEIVQRLKLRIGIGKPTCNFSLKISKQIDVFKRVKGANEFQGFILSLPYIFFCETKTYQLQR